MGTVSRAIIPFFLLQVFGLGICTAVPDLVLWLIRPVAGQAGSASLRAGLERPARSVRPNLQSVLTAYKYTPSVDAVVLHLAGGRTPRRGPRQKQEQANPSLNRDTDEPS